MGNPIVDKIRQAGVVGAGGAGLPTHVKADAKVDTVLVNGASCEPLLNSDPHIMEQEIDTMIRGLKAVMECTEAKKGIICLKGKHAKAMKAVREAVARDASGTLEAFELKDFYPAGDEQVLVYEVLGRIVPERGLPLHVGAVVSNSETFFNVAHAMDGKPVTITSTPQALKLGIGYLPRNRKENGIIKDMNILENGSIVTLPRLTKHGIIQAKEQLVQFLKQKKDLRIKMEKETDSITSLSGGNQQKVVLAKWLSANPKLLILDNPTQGVDVGAKEEIYDIIHRLSEQGVAIVVLCSEAQEIIRLCDRALVMYHGEVRAEVSGESMNEHEMMRLATGG